MRDDCAYCCARIAARGWQRAARCARRAGQHVARWAVAAASMACGATCGAARGSRRACCGARLAACSVRRTARGAACGKLGGGCGVKLWLAVRLEVPRAAGRWRVTYCGPQAAAPLPLPGPVAWGGPQHGPSACGVRPDHRPWPFRVQLIRLPPSPLHFHTPNLYQPFFGE